MRIMRDLARHLCVTIAIVLVACTPSVESQSSSTTNPSAWSSNESEARAPATTSVVPDKPTRWEHIDALGTYRRATPRTRSQHLQGEHEAEVLTNEAAAAYPTLGPSREMPPGSVVVEALYAPNQTEVAMYFAMVKQPTASGSEWQYAVVSKTGMVERRGALALCARCHAEAPHGQVFGRPH